VFLLFGVECLKFSNSSESRSNISSCSHLMKVSFDAAVSSSALRWLVFTRRRLELNLRPDGVTSLNGLPPLRMELLAGVIRNWRLVPGVGIVVLQVLKLSSFGIGSTLVGVLGDWSAMLVVEYVAGRSRIGNGGYETNKTRCVEQSPKVGRSARSCSSAGRWTVQPKFVCKNAYMKRGYSDARGASLPTS